VMSRRQPTPEEEREREQAGRELLEAVRAMREREARQREWLCEQVAKGFADKQADEEER
jgi:hypothetical protein